MVDENRVVTGPTAPSASSSSRAAVLVAKGPRLHTVPAHVETMALSPIAMPKAPTHDMRVLAVRPATDAGKTHAHASRSRRIRRA